MAGRPCHWYTVPAALAWMGWMLAWMVSDSTRVHNHLWPLSQPGKDGCELWGNPRLIRPCPGAVISAQWRLSLMERHIAANCLNLDEALWQLYGEEGHTQGQLSCDGILNSFLMCYDWLSRRLWRRKGHYFRVQSVLHNRRLFPPQWTILIYQIISFQLP